MNKQKSKNIKVTILSFHCEKCNEDIETILTLTTKGDIVNALDEHNWKIICPNCGQITELQKDKIGMSEIFVTKIEMARKLNTMVSQSTHEYLMNIKQKENLNTIGEAIDLCISLLKEKESKE